jgi:uncharacterized coiled-coil DUF342 family protein
MLTIQEQIKTLETILAENPISPKDRQILLKEIERLKQELAKQNNPNPSSK